MAAMSDVDRKQVSRRITEEMFVRNNDTATFPTSTIRASVNAIDDAMDALVSTLTDGDEIEVALRKQLSAVGSFKSLATIAQKDLVITWTMLKRFGLRLPRK